MSYDGDVEENDEEEINPEEDDDDIEVYDVKKSDENTMNFSADEYERYCMYDKYCRDHEEKQEEKEEDNNVSSNGIDQVELENLFFNVLISILKEQKMY